MTGDDDSEVSDDDVRAALRAIKTGDATLAHVLCLAAESDAFEPPLVSAEVIDAIAAKFEMDADVANGGLDQLVWNGGEAFARALAKSLRAIGAIENADVLDRLAAALVDYKAKNTSDAIASDPVRHFLAYRRAVGGPEFGIPDHGDELAEALVEYVLERKDASRDPDAPLVRKVAQ
jgi:hypothetical protein